MSQTAFSEISARYEQDSLIQKSAAERLLSLLAVAPNEAVLDLGCGTGHLTRRLRALTTAPVVGVDAGREMLGQARSLSAGREIDFQLAAAEEMAFNEDFDAIFCNSALQWFRDTPLALHNCWRALRPGGRMGMQAPATANFCPNIIRALSLVARDARTAEVWRTFQNPWLFLETSADYSRLFEEAGFQVPLARIEPVASRHPLPEAMTIFDSGAAAGYLNPSCYGAPVDDAYRAAFRAILRGSLAAEADERGLVTLVLHRIYLLAIKP